MAGSHKAVAKSEGTEAAAGNAAKTKMKTTRRTGAKAPAKRTKSASAKNAKTESRTREEACDELPGKGVSPEPVDFMRENGTMPGVDDLPGGDDPYDMDFDHPCPYDASGEDELKDGKSKNESVDSAKGGTGSAPARDCFDPLDDPYFNAYATISADREFRGSPWRAEAIQAGKREDCPDEVRQVLGGKAMRLNGTITYQVPGCPVIPDGDGMVRQRNITDAVERLTRGSFHVPWETDLVQLAFSTAGSAGMDMREYIDRYMAGWEAMFGDPRDPNWTLKRIYDPGGPMSVAEFREMDEDVSMAMGQAIDRQANEVRMGRGPMDEAAVYSALMEDRGPCRLKETRQLEAVCEAAAAYGRYLEVEDRKRVSNFGTVLWHAFWSEFLTALLDGRKLSSPNYLCGRLASFRVIKDGMPDWDTDLAQALTDEVWQGEELVDPRKVLGRMGKYFGFRFDAVDEVAWKLARGMCPPSEKGHDKAKPKAAAQAVPEYMAPKEILQVLDESVLGQAEAKRAVSMLMYRHLCGQREHMVIAGPSGCGKSELFRALSRTWPDHVRMFDTSLLSADGWKGSLHTRDFFEGIPEDVLAQDGLVLVLDEADKAFCETLVSGNGMDVAASVQSNLLKIMDGDVVRFGEDKSGQGTYVADCSKVSVVMLGTFEHLLKKRERTTKRIGFGNEAGGTAKTVDLSPDDLIEAGMRREIAGRVDKVAAVRPLSKEDYREILDRFVLPGLSKSSGLEVSVAPDCAEALVDAAVTSGLGVRWMRSRVLDAVDGMVFEDPEAETCLVESVDLGT